MDVLSDVFHQAGLRRRLLDMRRLGAGSALRFPCERSLGVHVVVGGPLFLHAASLKTPITLQAGDVALMARGCHHVLSTTADIQPARVKDVAPMLGSAPPEVVDQHGADAQAVISGAYQLWNDPVHPLFAELPAWHVLRSDAVPRYAPLSIAVAMLTEEVRHHDLGSETILHGLLDVVFGHLIRAVVSERGATAAGWSQAARDPQVRKALVLMHADVGAGWTLEELARRAGLSRSTLAERFRAAMGDTPLNYLRAVRMQKAIQLLSDSALPLEQIAQQVGYTDAFSFSKVFKRVVGVAPRDFRRQDAQQQALPWRLQSA